ncbi:beta/gamma crystallin domain-containing protein [Streptomyces sp. NPDC060022]|uniref:beta/gamma crystallin domain-containing protein n=1 Tax=Streptomyces sp. NPDC060022 TaxID=3347039 RepID=UPI0036CC05E6
MKRTTKRAVVAAIATGVLAVSLPVSSASAINNTKCTSRTNELRRDIVRVVYNHGISTACFANSGVKDVKLANVTRVTSGNNKIRWVGSGVVYRLDRYQVGIPKNNRPFHMTRLRIL